METVDVLIVGAGMSGIGAAYYMQKNKRTVLKNLTAYLGIAKLSRRHKEKACSTPTIASSYYY
jgi:thioredoxin reductase